MSKFALLLWFFVALLLFVYSYGFVDLNLTLSSNPLLFNFVSSIQHLVYFDRPLSLKIFVGLVVVLFFCYFVALYYWSNKPFPWLPISLLAIIFSLSYPMLSSDVFKYLFAAKEMLVYHANPYLVTPDMFVGDTWLRFMRWVHTNMPYGPVFLGWTVPYYLLGFGKFVPVLYLFKLDQIAWYLLTIWVIGKLTRSTRAQLFFALNPLILMEWLVNAHNDAIMLALLLFSIYLYHENKRGWSLFSLFLSIGVKYVTAIFLPFFLIKKKIPDFIIHYSLFITLAFTPLLYHYSYQYQPWYVTWLVPLAALIPSRTLRYTTVAYTFSVFSRYLYFVGTGSWLGTPQTHALLTFALPLVVLLVNLVYNWSHATSSQA